MMRLPPSSTRTDTLFPYSTLFRSAADLGGIGAALNLLVPIPVPLIVVGAAAIIFALQYFGSYMLIRRVFRWLALILLAYVAAAVMARPDPVAVLRATFIPALRIDAQSLSLIVARSEEHTSELQSLMRISYAV